MDTLYFPTKAARLSFIREKLATDHQWAIRTLEIIHDRQTPTEQTCERTTDANGRGFTAFDAEILTSFAKQVLRWNSRPNGYTLPLSEKQLVLLHKRIVKYAGQLLEASFKLQERLIVRKVESLEPVEA